MKPVICLSLISLLLFGGCNKKRQWHYYTPHNTNLTTGIIRQLIVKDNSLYWIGTYGGGLYRVQNKAWEKIESPFTGIYILSLVMDNNNGLWIGTARKGAYYYKNERWHHYSQDKGLIDKNVWDIYPDRAGNIWFCSRYRGISRKTGDSLSYFTTKNGLPDRQVTIAREDNTGRMWVGTVRGGLCNFKDEKISYVNTRHGLSGNYIRALICDSTARWVGSWDGGLDFFTGAEWKNIQGIKPPVVFLDFDPRGYLWVGSWGHGVYLNNGDKWENLTTKNSGLPNNYVIDIAFDEQGKAYFATSKGIAIYSYK